MLFRKIAKREVTGKIIDEFCYVAVCSFMGKLDKTSMENAIDNPLCFSKITNSMDWLLTHTAEACDIEAPKAFNVEKYAEKNVLEKLNKLPHADKSIFFEEKHLAKDSYWILTVKGKEEKVNDILRKIQIANKSTDVYFRLTRKPLIVEFSKHILYARNVDGSNVINAQKESKKNFGPS